MSTLFIALTTALILLSIVWYVLFRAITFEFEDISFTDIEVEQLNQDFKGGLRNVGRSK